MKRTITKWVALFGDGILGEVLHDKKPFDAPFTPVSVEITYDDGIVETEDREVKRWAVFTEKANVAGTFPTEADAVERSKCYPNSQIVELTGKYSAPVPQKEKKRVVIGGATVDITDFYGPKSLCPLDDIDKSLRPPSGARGTLTFEED